ncbi:SWIB/MDM2 domain-containing protein [Polluticoccus soli]|uniref:SWIB/MDM2 domain-containing protein n=1 Tax=Polluticoccus soli TaxID=3034150 RepID=UPI0023E17B49|nr:SWIB/MDM2 domain-containing protein [Flavipsychrobacter sp. JY13-12]
MATAKKAVKKAVVKKAVKKAAVKKAVKKAVVKKAVKKAAVKKAVKKAVVKKAVKKAVVKKAVKKAVVKKAAAKKKSTRKPNAAFMAPLTVSPALAEVIGTSSAARTEIVKKIWEYIRKHGLQDSKNRRMINADARLRPIFGKDQISMFELAKVVNKQVK